MVINTIYCSVHMIETNKTCLVLSTKRLNKGNPPYTRRILYQL